MFIGREKELAELNELYEQDRFQLYVLYGRRRVEKTTFLNEFCKDKDTIFYIKKLPLAKRIFRERRYTEYPTLCFASGIAMCLATER